jgi:hypothetical protein
VRLTITFQTDWLEFCGAVLGDRVQYLRAIAALIKAFPFAVDDYPLKNGFL